MEMEALSPRVRAPEPARPVRVLVPFMMTVPTPSRVAVPDRLEDTVSVVPSAARRMPGPDRLRVPPEMVRFPPVSRMASVWRVSPSAIVRAPGPLVTLMEA